MEHGSGESLFGNNTHSFPDHSHAFSDSGLRYPIRCPNIQNAAHHHIQSDKTAFLPPRQQSQIAAFPSCPEVNTPADKKVLPPSEVWLLSHFPWISRSRSWLLPLTPEHPAGSLFPVRSCRDISISFLRIRPFSSRCLPAPSVCQISAL